ncbi:MAG: hypothetical protein ACE367_25310 [Acidimicrobiales bacterium]
METSGVVLDHLRGVLNDVGDIPLSCWSRDELADWLCGLQDVRAQLDGLLCAAAAAGQSAALYQLDRARSLRQFVALRTGTNSADVGADLALGTWITTFPVVLQALTAGRITRRHAQHLRELDNPRTHRHLLNGIDYLVETAASDITWQDFIDICSRWLAHADPDGKLPDENERGRRCSTKKRADGTVSGQFNLDTIGGDAVRTAIEREAHRLFCIDADPSNPEWKQRNHTQRMADALVNLITRGALRTDRTVGAPLIHVVVGLEIIEEAMCRKAAAEAGVLPVGPDGQPLGDDLRIDPNNPLRRCELVDGTPLHPNQVLALLGVATIRRIVLDADGEILDIGRASRKFPQYMKDAATAAQRGRCCEHGCDAKPTWLHADHIVPWTPNDPGKPAGRTATRNLQMLCGSGNHAKSNRPNPPPPTPPARAKPNLPPRSQTARPRHSTRRAELADDGPEPGSQSGEPSPRRDS